MTCFIVNNKGIETGVAIEELESIEFKDGVIIINDIIELLPEKIVEIKINNGDDNMEKKEMIKKVKEIIRKYLNVEIIDSVHNLTFTDFELNLYDHLDKPGNFENDIECIIHEIQPVVPTSFTISHEYYSDHYWDGENMVESNLSCTLRIKYVGDSQ